MNDSQNIDPAIVRFIDVARRYCAWVESKPEEPLPEIQRARRLLAELHLAALNLPDIGVGEDVLAREVPAEDWRRYIKDSLIYL